MPDYIELFSDMVKNDAFVETGSVPSWDEFQIAAAEHLFDSLGEDDKWWGVH